MKITFMTPTRCTVHNENGSHYASVTKRLNISTLMTIGNTLHLTHEEVGKLANVLAADSPINRAAKLGIKKDYKPY